MAFRPGYSYRNQWWVLHNADGAFEAAGVHGQMLHINPRRDGRGEALFAPGGRQWLLASADAQGLGGAGGGGAALAMEPRINTQEV